MSLDYSPQRSRCRRSAAVVLTLAALPALAGHGFMNAFNDVEWLPHPGLTPDVVGYRLDTAMEALRLALAGDVDEVFALSLEFAAEKLAEIDLMVRRQRPHAAGAALAAYRGYLQRARETLAADAGSADAPRLRRLAVALLEHQYLLAVDYLDLPRDARPVLGDAAGAAAALYGELRGRMARAERDALFFREEEVRWSWEMARQADAQGL